MIKAKIVLDSINAETGHRITTFLLTYPRFILAELNTHRALSRNSASSRAIPVAKVLKNVWWKPAMPVSWGQNCRGMQAKKELPPSRQLLCRTVWRLASKAACGFSWLLAKLGAHKQVTNRLTEPFATMTTLVTATDWDNFFALRTHPDAQPEFQRLAKAMLDAYLKSKPKRLMAGEWHIPFGDCLPEKTDYAFWPHEERLKIATARAARTSYQSFDGASSPSKDFELHDSLLAAGHCSPFEHSAQAMSREEWEEDNRNAKRSQGNFTGFKQYRKTLPNENRSFSYAQAKPQ